LLSVTYLIIDFFISPAKTAASGIIGGKCILLFFSFWGKEKRNHVSSSTFYLAFSELVVKFC